MTDLAPGFTDAPVEAARAFRQLLEVMARPGEIRSLFAPGHPGFGPAMAAALLTLVDETTPVWLGASVEAAGGWLTFHTGGRRTTDPGEASFAAGTWDEIAPLDRFGVGTPDYPDRSATLIVEVPALEQVGPKLTGPGIETSARLNLPDAAALRRNAELYPLGQDFFFTCGDRIAALPRSTRILEAA